MSHSASCCQVKKASKQPTNDGPLTVLTCHVRQATGYDPQKDQMNTLDRRTQTTIFRLRTGHCGLRKHLKRLGLVDSAHCECGSEEQTPKHMLQTRLHLEAVRQQFWPEDTEVGTKTWGQAAELQRMMDHPSSHWPEDLPVTTSNIEEEGKPFKQLSYPTFGSPYLPHLHHSLSPCQSGNSSCRVL